MKLSVLQMTSTDLVENNEAQLFDLIAQTPEDTDLICTPENSLFLRVTQTDHKGFTFDLSEDVFKRLLDKMAERGASLLLGSIPFGENGYISNATVLVDGSGARVVYRKMHLFDVDVEGEKSLQESDEFEHGPEPAVIEVAGWKLGLSICYDLRFPELYLKYAKQNVDMILVPAAFLVPTGQAHWHVLLRARAIENQCFVVAPGQAGEHIGASGRSRSTFGHSLVIDPWGKVLADAEEPQPQAINLSLDKEAISKVKRQIPMGSHRRDSLWS